MNVQQAYEILKVAIVKDNESDDDFHNHTFGAAMGIVAALEALGVVKSVGLPLDRRGQ